MGSRSAHPEIIPRLTPDFQLPNLGGISGIRQLASFSQKRKPTPHTAYTVWNDNNRCGKCGEYQTNTWAKEKNNRHGDSLKEREPESARQCREFRPSCANREAPETGTDTGGEEKKKTILTEPLFELLLLLLVLAP